MVKRVEAGNKEGKLQINLKGLLVGSPYMNSIIQAKFPDSWFNIGLIDEEQKKEVEDIENNIQSLIQEKKFGEAHVEVFKLIMVPDILYSKFTGFAGQQLNYLNGTDSPLLRNFKKFIDDKEVHYYLHVGLHNFEIFNFKVHDKFNAEIMAGDGKAMEGVLDDYKVLIYSSQMDPLWFTHKSPKPLRLLSGQGLLNSRKHLERFGKLGMALQAMPNQWGDFIT